MSTAAEPSPSIDLAEEPDFELGGLLISPSACRVRHGDAEQRLEPRVMEVLVTLAQRAPRTVTRDQLIDACWGGRVVSDDAVTRVVAQVRNLARSFEPPPFLLETVPKVGFRLLPGGAADLAPPVVTPVASESPEVASPADAEPPALRWFRRRVLVVAGAVALIAALGVGVWWWFATPRGLTADQNGRVDVMVFEPVSQDPDLRRFGAELSGSIVRVLTNAGVQTTEHPLARDAAASDSELRLAGTVDREGDNYVVEAQILDRKTGLVLWTDRLQRPVGEVVQSPGEIAWGVSAILHCALEDRKPAHTAVSTEAFGLYLNACAAVFVDERGSGRMLAVTRRLVKAAPRFAGAHAMHSIAAALAANGIEHAPAEAAKLHAESEAAAYRALKLDPNTPKAYSGLAINAGALSDRMGQNWVLEEKYLRKALALDPDLPPARNEYVGLLRSTGRWNEAIEYLSASNDTGDPRNGLDPRAAMMLAARGDMAAAYERLEMLTRVERISHDSMKWTIAFWWEDPKTALTTVRELMPQDEPRERRECFERYLIELDARRANGTRGLPAGCELLEANTRARMLARVGDLDGAYATMEKGIPGGPLSLYYPEMKEVRRDPRFWPLAERIGLVDYWTKSGHWPDFCDEADLPYNCHDMARRVQASR